MGYDSLPPRRSPTRKDISPTQRRSSHRDVSPARGKHASHAKSPKHASHAKSPKHARSISPAPRSPSPRTKRLRKIQAEKEAEKMTDREHERNRDSRNGRSFKREGGSEKEILNERKEKSSDTGAKSSRSRHGHSSSSSDRHQKTKHRSHSPQRNGEKLNERDYERNGRGSEKSKQKERGTKREREDKIVDKRSGRDDSDHRSSRSRHNRSTSPSYGQHKSRHRSHSPQPAADSRDHDEALTSTGTGQRNDEDDESIAKMKAAEEALEVKQKQKPSFELSGKLAAETNRFRGVTLLYNEPPDAYKPNIRWRLYVFKAGEVLNEPLYIHRQSCYLFGRERRVADIPTDHPSCSKQHAVIQFRRVEREQPDGMLSKQVSPYLMDLGSTNKTFLNEVAIEPQRYYELHEKDTIKFGNSSREYVLLHENSAT